MPIDDDSHNARFAQSAWDELTALDGDYNIVISPSSLAGKMFLDLQGYIDPATYAYSAFARINTVAPKEEERAALLQAFANTVRELVEHPNPGKIADLAAQIRAHHEEIGRIGGKEEKGRLRGREIKAMIKLVDQLEAKFVRGEDIEIKYPVAPKKPRPRIHREIPSNDA